jgi:hypothetical protein
MPSPYPLPPGCIFREDFRNPTLAAQNGLVITGNPFAAAGLRMVAGSLVLSTAITASLLSAPKTFIWSTVFTGSSGQYQTLMRLSQGSGRVFQIGIKNDSNSLFWVAGGAVYTNGSVIPTGRKLFAIVSNGTVLTFYANGSQIGSASDGFAKPTGAATLSIGSELGGSLIYRDLVDQIRIYDYAMSADEIAQDYRTIRGLQA